MQRDSNRPHLSIVDAVSGAQHTLRRLQREATQIAALDLNSSLAQLIEVQQYFSLRATWTPEQVRRQQERIARHQARVEWQRAVLAQLRAEHNE